jgi:anaerobic nitric oxide reductase flavorubredoxin
MKKITERVSWVGKVDWELRRFHGDEYSTDRGSSYNAYLIQDEKTALIDTVWGPYDKEYVKHLKEDIDLSKVDYIIMDHSETDHSGALPELMREIPNVPIYCTKKGEAIIRGHYHQDWNFVTVKTGDTLNLGKTTVHFVEAPFLHWPDSMFSYLEGENILFTSDAFGQHYATESLFDEDAVMSEVTYEAEKYWANIINTYANLATKKLNQLLDMGLKIDYICPSHGVIWHKYVGEIIDKYIAWADAYKENQITIVYDTMWQGTRKMAEAIAKGIREADPKVVVKIYNVTKEDKNDVMAQIFQSKAILVGSPTINYSYTFAIAGILEMAEGLRFKKKKAAAFGSYGWTGDAPKKITAKLKESGFDIVNDGIRQLWVPDEKAIEECRQYGRDFVKAIAEDK